jgi:acetoin utilization deacetylase AcuC-like enzyme
MRLSTGQFARMTARLRDVADECCDGRLVAVVEGGYDTAALADSLRAVIQMLDRETPLNELPAATGDTRRAEVSLAAVRTQLAKAWTL